ncbi:hypothetical protein Anapl_09900 [Anas platyrhynchos]|uniref:Uncharacterized protein n=1 Tax=Anas platyrhynchos TaxID=8839 RepID=R0LUG9_ANAPL|nr:hypothetical protein Anapl_09900 [Anas platyrhynchos]
MSLAASQHVQSQSKQGQIHTHRSTSQINLTHILVPCSPNKSQPKDAEREEKEQRGAARNPHFWLQGFVLRNCAERWCCCSASGFGELESPVGFPPWGCGTAESFGDTQGSATRPRALSAKQEDGDKDKDENSRLQGVGTELQALPGSPHDLYTFFSHDRSSKTCSLQNVCRQQAVVDDSVFAAEPGGFGDILAKLRIPQKCAAGLLRRWHPQQGRSLTPLHQRSWHDRRQQAGTDLVLAGRGQLAATYLTPLCPKTGRIYPNPIPKAGPKPRWERANTSAT